MNTVSANFGIVPKGLSLNDFSKFLCRHKDSKYLLYDDIFPKPLYAILFYVIRLAQDGSHDTPDLQYGVHRYVSETHDVLIIRSLLFAIIELISWFTLYLANNTIKEKNLAKWKER